MEGATSLILSEEYDTVNGRMLGNFPQARATTA
jgi:GH15 family glucan-1,4-alpha-glucosidase